MTVNLRSKAIIITGAFGSLGAATARDAAQAGARVTLVDRAAEAPRGLVEDCGPEAIAIGGVDLTNASDAAQP